MNCSLRPCVRTNKKREMDTVVERWKASQMRLGVRGEDTYGNIVKDNLNTV